MRALGRLLLAVMTFAALPVCASELTLVAPRAGSTLAGGRSTTIEWRGAALPREAEEWEAFLSVDGGAHYAYRVTPHLDLARSRFTFEVPNVATEDARILIRVGDEHRETEFEIAGSFRIERDERLATAVPRREILEAGRGESAREGEAGVIEWVEGDRRGGHLASRTAWRDVPALRAGTRNLSQDSHADAAFSAPATLSLPHVAALARHDDRQPACAEIIHDRSGRDVLLVSSRLNI